MSEVYESIQRGLDEAVGKAFAHRTANRKGDLFETPYGLTRLLMTLEEWDFDKPVYEPCAGKGAIVKVLKENFKDVRYSDKYYGDNLQDFLESEEPFEQMITNPPYGETADDIVLHAKKLYTGKFSMMLRTNYLSGQKRFFKDVYSELKTVHIFNRMPDMQGAPHPTGKFTTSAIVYAWFTWEKGYTGDPAIKFVDVSDLVLKKSEI